MNLSLPLDSLISYVVKQLENTFPDGMISRAALEPSIIQALARVEYCFSHIKVKHYCIEGKPFLNHLHSGQYSIFLYYLANTIWVSKADEILAAKVYYLNKALHSIDVFYQVELPDVFFLEHPLGTVLGRAKYSNYFVAYQHCTVGGNLDLEYPVFEEGVALLAGASVIGNCHIQKNSWVAADTLVIDTSCPEENKIIVGKHPNELFKPAKMQVKDRFFL